MFDLQMITVNNFTAHEIRITWFFGSLKSLTVPHFYSYDMVTLHSNFSNLGR